MQSLLFGAVGRALAFLMVSAAVTTGITDQPMLWRGDVSPAVASVRESPREIRKKYHPVITQKQEETDCQKVGLCDTGQKRVILPPSNAVTIRYYKKEGCTINHVVRGGIAMKCPKTVAVKNARVERLFRVKDMNADQQIGALGVQQQLNVTGNGVRVAVLDTGVDTSHPELAGKIIAQQVFTSDSSVDMVGHGTHVSGIIAGQGVTTVYDANGVADRALGVAPGAGILSAKVCNDQGWCAESDIIAGIEWAVAQKARVINMSFGGGQNARPCDSDTLAQEVNWASGQGVVIVAASGNEGETGAGIALPACASQAIAVGAVDASDIRTSWSGYGAGLDVVAPGVNILSSVSCNSNNTCPAASYGWWSGTSMATPQVTGLVALLLEANPSLTPAQVRAAIDGTAKDLGTPGTDDYNGYGRIDALAAVQSVTPSSSSSSSVPAASSSSSVASSVSSTSSVASSSSSSTVSSSSSSSNSSSSSVASSQQSSAVASSASSEREHDDREEFDHPRGTGSTLPPLPCSANAWFCRDYGDCNTFGWQDRFCQLLDARCKNPDVVKPAQTRACEAHQRSQFGEGESLKDVIDQARKQQEKASKGNNQQQNGHDR
jgi:subtilisin family serine protease